MPTNLLQTKNLSFNNKIHYRDLSVDSTSRIHILGPSGSGKSVLLKLITRILRPSSGSIYYKEKDNLNYDPLELRREILLVGQSSYVFPSTIRDAFDKISFYTKQKKLSDQAMKKLLELVVLDYGLDQDTSNFSGGEKQRLYLATFLSQRPKIFLLDEPTSALDIDTSRTFFGNLYKYFDENDLASLTICHNNKLSEEFAKEIYRTGDTDGSRD